MHVRYIACEDGEIEFNGTVLISFNAPVQRSANTKIIKNNNN